MSHVAIGKRVPDFTADATDDKRISLSSLTGQNVVIYFYPKDNTPGCTLEGQDFARLNNDFAAANTIILGVSRDSVKSHDNFRCKYAFPFDLLSDKDETICRLFDVIRPKMMYGKHVVGIERSTFLIDAKGVLRTEWRKVSAKGHAELVLAQTQALIRV